MLLGSSPNGDDNLYRLSFEPGWEKALENLERRGFMAAIGANLKQLADAAAAWHGEPMPGADGPFDVVVNHHIWSGWDPSKFDAWIAEVRDYEKLFPVSAPAICHRRSGRARRRRCCGPTASRGAATSGWPTT